MRLINLNVLLQTVNAAVLYEKLLQVTTTRHFIRQHREFERHRQHREADASKEEDNSEIHSPDQRYLDFDQRIPQ